MTIFRHPAPRPRHLPRPGPRPRRRDGGRPQQRRLGAPQGKGDDRPINTLADRLAVMAALGCVDLVTWFDEDTPIARILECQPDVLVKGGHWAPERIVGAPETLARGGSVHSIPFEHQRSTTALLDKIRRL